MSPLPADIPDNCTTVRTPARRASACTPGMSAYPGSMKTPSAPSRTGRRLAGSFRSPDTTSTPDGKRPGSADLVTARTGCPAFASAATSSPPTLPAAPVTTIIEVPPFGWWAGPTAGTVGPGRLEAADDLGQRGLAVLAGDEVRQAEPLAPRVEIGADLVRAADEDRGHLPDLLDVDPAPAAPGDQILGAGPALSGDDERADRAELKAAEAVPGRLTEHADLSVERRRQPVRWIVAVG